jgi:hypothetical protein
MMSPENPEITVLRSSSVLPGFGAATRFRSTSTGFQLRFMEPPVRRCHVPPASPVVLQPASCCRSGDRIAVVTEVDQQDRAALAPAGPGWKAQQVERPAATVGPDEDIDPEPGKPAGVDVRDD